MFATDGKIRNLAEELIERHLSIMLTAFSASFAWPQHESLLEQRGDKVPKDSHDAVHVLHVSAHI